MTPPLQTRGQLFWLPALAVFGGVVPAFLLSLLLGDTAAAALGVAFAAVMFAALGYTGYRSVFGTTQGLVSCASLFGWFGLTVAAATAALMQMLGLRPFAAMAGATSLAATAIVLAWSVRSSGRRLRGQGSDAAWLRSAVDWRRGVILDGATPESVPVWRSPWWVAALAVNLPWAWRAFGVGDGSVMPWLALILNVAAGWLMAAFVGPLLARTLFLRRLEAERGVRLVHANLLELQALRRQGWLSRRLMPPDPPQLSDKPGRAAPAKSAARR